MRKLELFLIALLVLCGFVYYWVIYPSPEAAVRRIRVGMLEEEVRAAMKPVAVDSGTIYWGGSGARRIYFELPNNQQVWFDFEGGPPQHSKVHSAGFIEPKQRWIRHTGNSISIEGGYMTLPRIPNVWGATP